MLKKLTLLMSIDFIDSLKIQAIKEKTSVSRLIVKVMTEYMAKVKKTQ